MRACVRACVRARVCLANVREKIKFFVVFAVVQL